MDKQPFAWMCIRLKQSKKRHLAPKEKFQVHPFTQSVKSIESTSTIK